MVHKQNIYYLIVYNKHLAKVIITVVMSENKLETILDYNMYYNTKI